MDQGQIRSVLAAPPEDNTSSLRHFQRHIALEVASTDVAFGRYKATSIDATNSTRSHAFKVAMVELIDSESSASGPQP